MAPEKSAGNSMSGTARSCTASVAKALCAAIFVATLASSAAAQSTRNRQGRPVCEGEPVQDLSQGSGGVPDESAESVQFLSFAYVSRTILVQTHLENSSGKGMDATFVLDTGNSQTTLDTATAKILQLPHVGTSTAHYFNGSAPEQIVKLRSMKVGDHECQNLDVAVQDLTMFSKIYQRDVNGMIGTDYLRSLNMLIDYPRRRLAFLERPMQMKEFREVGSLSLLSEGGLFLARCKLSTGLGKYFIVDTGHDAPEDVLISSPAPASILPSGPLTADRTLSDPTGSAQVVSGQIPWMDCGELHLAPANVAVKPQGPPSIFNTYHDAGLMGNGLFEKFVMEVDGPDKVLRFLQGPPTLTRRSVDEGPATHSSPAASTPAQ